VCSLFNPFYYFCITNCQKYHQKCCVDNVVAAERVDYEDGDDEDGDDDDDDDVNSVTKQLRLLPKGAVHHTDKIAQEYRALRLAVCSYLFKTNRPTCFHHHEGITTSVLLTHCLTQPQISLVQLCISSRYFTGVEQFVCISSDCCYKC